MLLSVHVTSVLFLVRFNNFALTMGCLLELHALALVARSWQDDGLTTRLNYLHGLKQHVNCFYWFSQYRFCLAPGCIPSGSEQDDTTEPCNCLWTQPHLVYKRSCQSHFAWWNKHIYCHPHKQLRQDLHKIIIYIFCWHYCWCISCCHKYLYVIWPCTLNYRQFLQCQLCHSNPDSTIASQWLSRTVGLSLALFFCSVFGTCKITYASIRSQFIDYAHAICCAHYHHRGRVE